MAAPASMALTNQFLIAMPGMADPNFASTVTLVCEHSESGALGIVINRPLQVQLGGLLAQLDVTDPDPDAAKRPVFHGGPVGIEKGFVLHNAGLVFEHTLAVSSDIQLTFSRAVLDAIAQGDGPEKSLVALGYAGWDAGQLEQEMLDNTWLSVPATPEIVFDLPVERRWAAAAGSLGIDINRLGPDAGHA